MDPLSLGVGVGLSLWQSHEQNEASEGAARAGIASINRQLELSGKHRKELESLYAVRGEQITTEYGTEYKSLVNRISDNLWNIGEEYDSQAGKTGFEYSGTLNRRKMASEREQGNQFAGQLESMYNTLNREMFEMNLTKTRELGQLTMQEEVLKGERSMLKSEAGISTPWAEIEAELASSYGKDSQEYESSVTLHNYMSGRGMGRGGWKIG